MKHFYKDVSTIIDIHVHVYNKVILSDYFMTSEIKYM
jgi:hypothetical protein